MSQLRVVPKEQWQSIDKAQVCQNPDCAARLEKKLFSGKEAKCCEICGLVMCPRCLPASQTAAVPPKIPSPVPSCSRCCRLAAAYAQKRARSVSVAEYNNNNASFVAVSPSASSPSSSFAASPSPEPAAEDHRHRDESPPTSTAASPPPPNNADNALVASLQQQLKTLESQHQLVVTRLIEKYEAKMTAAHEALAAAEEQRKVEEEQHLSELGAMKESRMLLVKENEQLSNLVAKSKRDSNAVDDLISGSNNNSAELEQQRAQIQELESALQREQGKSAELQRRNEQQLESHREQLRETLAEIEQQQQRAEEEAATERERLFAGRVAGVQEDARHLVALLLSEQEARAEICDESSCALHLLRLDFASAQSASESARQREEFEKVLEEEREQQKQQQKEDDEVDWHFFDVFQQNPRRTMLQRLVVPNVALFVAERVGLWRVVWFPVAKI